MLRITRVERHPFYTLPYRTSGPSGKAVFQQLPFHRAFASGLPADVKALVLTSDLQGREHAPANRLMGVAVAENLAALVTEKSIPAPQVVLLCGDLYDYPDCHKRGGTGPVDDVYAAFSDFVPHVIGVHGNHDELADGDSLPGNAVILDGQIHDAAGLRIGGVSGIVGDPCRHRRRTAEDFLTVMEHVTAQHPEFLLLHQGPEDEERLRKGDPDITLSLETGYAGLTVFGHTRWEWPCLISIGDGQALNVDGRVVVLCKDD